MNNKIINIIINSTETSKTPMLMPAFNGIFMMFKGSPFKDAKAVLELASVFILIPNHATP